MTITPVISILTAASVVSRQRPGTPERERFRARALAAALPFPARTRRDPSGRPRLEPAPRGTFDLSCSSTQGRMVVAVSAGALVGVDVEHVRREWADDALLSETLSDEELTLVRGLPDPELGFFHAWCRKEAVLKGIGVGLLEHPRRVRVMGHEHDRGWTLTRTSGGVWFVRSFDVGRDVCAVATDRPGADIRMITLDEETCPAADPS